MGQVTKLCNNAISGCVLLLIAETIALARKADIDVTHFAEALKGGVADSPHLQIFGQRMAEHRFEPRLGAIGLIERDVNLASELAAAHGAHTPILSLVRQLYAAARQEPSIDMTADVSRLIGLFESVAQDGRS
jgi:3-hydroxyisobutyrate dehydrogenase-like beta-hydroxyacid dehydrogenase